MLTTRFVHGSPSWLEIATRDVDATAAYYRDLFGWEYVSAGPDAGGYGFLQLDDRIAAGIAPLFEEGASPTWTVYFQTADADATAKAAEQAGGTVRMPPTDVFTAGRAAVIVDPTGADFAVWQPRDRPGLGVANEPRSLNWMELYTTDAARAREFYDALFHWDAMEMPMPDVSYTLISPQGDGPDAMFGGIMQLTEENLAAGNASEWHPVFEVTDVDGTFAKAMEHGSGTLIPPMDMEEIGRLAMFTDPQGTTLSILKPPSAAA